MTKSTEEQLAEVMELLKAQKEQIEELEGFKTIAKEYQSIEFGVKYHEEMEKLKAAGKSPEVVEKQQKKMRAILDKSKMSKKAHKLEIRYHEGEEWVTVESI